MTLLSIRNLSLSIHAHPILKGVHLDIAAGEIVAITGESGSGKSMTALAAMQLLPQGATTKGEILLEGQDLTALPEKTLCAIRGNDIGMVFQEPMTALNPVQTIGAQVAETIRVHDRSATRAQAEARAAETLNRVGLPPDRYPLSRFPHELSGGQRQRVVIAMAIALRPRLLIADEPTTALDVTTQAQILTLLTRLVREDGMGMMMITHDLAVVADMADRIVVMRHGEVVEQGETQALLRNMQHPYTKMLFAASTHQADMPPAPEQRDPILTVDRAVRTYPLPRKLMQPRAQFTAVDGVSFEVCAGERVGLVGESGCGKSTLTRAILGLEPLQGGRITAFGAEVGPGMQPAARSGMQVVFQDPFGSFNPRHRVARLITEPFHLMPNPPQGTARREAIARALTDVGLKPSDADRYIHEFSGGQRQRIAIARALIIRPELIILDEAVSALDVSVRAQILDLLAELGAAYKLAYLFISHDLSVVRSVTDRVLVMQAGRIVEQGPTEQVFTDPQQAYTAKLIAAAPVLPDLAQA